MHYTTIDLRPLACIDTTKQSKEQASCYLGLHEVREAIWIVLVLYRVGITATCHAREKVILICLISSVVPVRPLVDPN